MLKNIFSINALCIAFLVYAKDIKKSKYLGDPLSNPMAIGPLGTNAYSYPYA